MIRLSEKALVTYDQAREYVLPDQEPSRDQERTLRALINGVSAAFEDLIQRPIIKQRIKELQDGGSKKYFLRYYPAEELTVTVEGRPVRAALYGDSGVVVLEEPAPKGRLNVEFVYTAGYGEQVRKDGELVEVKIGHDWQMYCLQAINYFFNKDLAHFARAAEGVLITPDILPASVQDFLKRKRAVF